jgi:hypothetical protein
MKYPIGIQDFRKLREGGFVYVDKTQHIFNMLQGGNYFFLSRPRRFGKSLLLSTMNELYSGSRDLFDGLWIQDQWDWEQMQRPVIWLKFASQGIRTMGLLAGLHHMLDSEAKRLNVVLTEQDFSLKFRELIKKVAGNGKVVLLIDEYDKPIIDNLDNIPLAVANREVLKSFYSVLKDSDPYIELLFITGVSAFSKVSIFSDLNNLSNLTLSRYAHTLLGLTQQELETNFPQQMSEVDREKMKTWYNGYAWGEQEKVYNPFSVLRFFNEEYQYQNFWFETGTPTFLVRAMKDQGNYNVKAIQVSQNKLSAFDFTRLDPITVLFQTGYLTITHYEPEDFLYTLDYPNMEVRQSLEQNLLTDYLDFPVEDPLARVVGLRNALRKKDIAEVINIMNATFASLPYDLWQSDKEHFFHAIIHLTFSLLGTYIRSEAHTAQGRCDALVETADHIYVFEFKRDKTAAEALQQIKDKGYLLPYADSNKERIAVGVNFSSETKQVVEWAVA